ncbi:MAG: restriction endonuclease [Burkholderiaceae bacterium]|nr:restriction endonuclease [Burkholderiaceae bacterium]
MLPLLQAVSDGRDYTLKVVESQVGGQFSLTEEEMRVLLPSGGAPLFYNRLAWAKTHLKKAGLVAQTKRGVFRITAVGKELLQNPPGRIDMAYLQRYSSYARSASTAVETPAEVVASAAEATPDEIMEAAHARSLAALADEVLDRVKSCPPEFFERLVVRLLIQMGYGGSKAEAGRAVGKSGDGGIDGIINEDRLGLDAIYLQAKRWEGVVGRPEIMKFVGALAGQRATKGVFITTSWFTQEAKDYAASSQYKVVLIDGARLSDLMIEHNLGVSVVASYHLKRIDSDFFADE